MSLTANPQTDRLLKQGFRYLNVFMVWMWRLGLGRLVNLWPAGTGRILVLGTTGRRTGLKRYNGVNYAELNGEIYCLAGFGGGSDWYRNLRANPQVEVWLPDSWYAALAEDVTGGAGHTTIVRQVLIASGFAARLEGIEPKLISDEEVNRRTASYRLVKLHLTGPRTGRGGPGDLAWVWPAATLFLLLTRPTRRRRRR